MRLTVTMLLTMLCLGQTFGQSIQRSPLHEKDTQKSYPIDGTPLLQKQYLQAAEYVASHPEEFQSSRLQKISSWGFSVGATHQWWTYNYVSGVHYQTSSTCRGVGTNCYIFVEDSLWNTRVTQASVDSIRNDFDNKTPANSGKGIFAMDTSAFGTPPDVDGDPKIIILICNIQDGYSGTGGYIAGFFDPSQEISGTTSNHAEIYYIDANPANLSSTSGIQAAMSTTAHEFQHMINWNYHKTAATQEPTFVNESCSKLAELYCGYPPDGLDLYSNETNIYLFTWRTDDNTLVLNDYARAQRFSLYMWDRFGIGIFKYIVQSSQTSGTGIINDALTKDGTSLTFNDLFSNWLIANELNDTTSNRLYGYAYQNLPPSNGKSFYNPNTSSTDTVKNLAAEYLIFKGGTNLSATFNNTGGNSNLSVTAIEMGTSSNNVVDVPFGTPFSEPNFGSTYNEIAFVVVNKDPNNSAIYNYSTSGVASTAATELKWDNTEPVDYYSWATSDTICVTYDALPQGILDSIRIALRRAGSINGGVYQYTGVARPTPLGKQLASITATSTDSATINPTTHNYVVPYNNWATIDLTSQNISTGSPFVIAFTIGSNPYAPGVMVTDYPGTNFYHSYTYLNSSEGASGAGWYFISSSDTTVAIYLIRAYVSVQTGVKQVVEVLPARFNLQQNYPNPFNPTTTINYQLPTNSHVTLKVFDVLGREVATLVNAQQTPGNHSVAFSARNLPSGVYFYRITAGNFSEVKKLVLEK
jgi:hypothetical protein